MPGDGESGRLRALGNETHVGPKLRHHWEARGSVPCADGPWCRGVGIAICREFWVGDVKEPSHVEGASVVSDPDLQGRWAFIRVYLGGVLCSPGHEEHDLFFLQQVVGLFPGGQVVVSGDLNGHVQYRDSKPAVQRTSEAGASCAVL